MQTRSFRGSGEPARVNASSNARFGLGADPRRALGPAAIRAASTGRTHDRTRPMLHQRKKALVNQAPSTHDSALLTHAAGMRAVLRHSIDMCRDVHGQHPEQKASENLQGRMTTRRAVEVIPDDEQQYPSDKDADHV